MENCSLARTTLKSSNVVRPSQGNSTAICQSRLLDHWLLCKSWQRLLESWHWTLAPWHCKYVFWPFVFPSGFFQSLSQSAHVKLLLYKLLATVSWLLGYPQNYPSCRSCMQICTDLKQWYALNYSKYHHHLATGNVNFNNPISIIFYLFKECGHHRWTNISHCSSLIALEKVMSCFLERLQSLSGYTHYTA